MFYLITFLYLMHYICFFYFIKAHELDSNDTSILNSILDFGEPPEIVLTEDQKKYYAAKLLALEPESEKALAIINS